MTKFDELDALLGDNEDARVLLGRIEILYNELNNECDDLTDQVSRLERDKEDLEDELRDAEKAGEDNQTLTSLMEAFADPNNWTDGRWTPTETKYQLWDADQLAYRALQGIEAEAR